MVRRRQDRGQNCCVFAHIHAIIGHPRRVHNTLLEILGFLWHYRKHPEALEPFLDTFRARGVPEPNIHNVRNAMILWRETYLDTASTYRIDSYLLTGIGAIDLILLTILVPLGVSDERLFWAFVALIVSLVLAGAALFINFAKRDLGISTYGKIHGAVISMVLISGALAMAGMLWYIDVRIAALFLSLVLIVWIICIGYYVTMRLLLAMTRILEATNAQAEPGEPTE